MSLYRSLLLSLALGFGACSAEFRSSSDSSENDAANVNGVVSFAPGQLPTVSVGGGTTGGMGSAPSTPGSGNPANPSGGAASTGGAAMSPGGSTALGGASSGTGGGASTPSGGGGGLGSRCREGKVTLRLLPPAAASAQQYCVNDCSVGWLEITTEDGTSMVTDLPCGAVTCDRCEPTACAKIACVSSPLTSQGLAFEWDGTRFLANSCGSSNLCQERTCVPEGRYLAKMCAPVSETANGQECVTSERIVCTAPVPFDFPGTDQVVTGTLPAP